MGAADKVNVGDPFRIKARTFNSFVDAADAWQNTQDVLQTVGDRNELPQQATVFAINGAGVNLDPGTPVKLQAADPTPGSDTFKLVPTFDVLAAGNVLDRIAVVRDGIPVSGIGLAVVSGVVASQVDANGFVNWIDRCAVKSGGGFELHPGGPHRVLWRESGEDGDKWAYLLINEYARAVYRGTVTGANIAADGTGDVDIGTPTGAAAYNVTAHLSWMHGDEQISSGKEVMVEYFYREDKWIITGAECE